MGKDFAIANIPVIAGKYRHGHNFRNETKRDIDVYKLEYDGEPEAVSTFLAGVFNGELELTSDNALEFHHLADYLQCLETKTLIKNYICENMDNNMLLRAWAFGDDFKESCEQFIAKTEVFDCEMFLNEICLLSWGQLQHLINKVGGGFNMKGSMLVRLLLKWLDHSSNKQFCAELTMSVDFENVRSDDREKYFSAILDDLELELIKSCWKKIFQKSEPIKSEPITID